MALFQELQGHIKTVHQKIYPGQKDKSTYQKILPVQKDIFTKVFECNTCAKVFHDQNILRVHKKTVHEGPKYEKHRCTICHRDFNSKSTHDAHVKVIHGGCIKVLEKCDFYCEFCGKSFLNSICKTSHINKVHGRNLN